MSLRGRTPVLSLLTEQRCEVSGSGLPALRGAEEDQTSGGTVKTEAGPPEPERI